MEVYSSIDNKASPVRRALSEDSPTRYAACLSATDDIGIMVLLGDFDLGGEGECFCSRRMLG